MKIRLRRALGNILGRRARRAAKPRQIEKRDQATVKFGVAGRGGKAGEIENVQKRFRALMGQGPASRGLDTEKRGIVIVEGKPGQAGHLSPPVSKGSQKV